MSDIKEPVYQTSLYRQTCTCLAGQYGRWCKHLTALAEQQATASVRLAEKVAAAQARWAREVEIQNRARAAEVARNRWSANYPGTD